MPLTPIPVRVAGDGGHVSNDHPIIHDVVNSIINAQNAAGPVFYGNANGDVSSDVADFFYNEGTDTLTVTNLNVTGTLTSGAAFTQGSVLFAGVGGVTSQDNANLYYDDATDRAHFGPRASFAELGTAQVNVYTTGDAMRLVRDTTAQSGSYLQAYNPNTTDNNGMRYTFATDTTGAGAATRQTLASFGVTFQTHDHATRKAYLSWYTSNSNTPVERMRMGASGVIAHNHTVTNDSILYSLAGTLPGTGTAPIGIFSDVTYPSTGTLSASAFVGRVNTAASAFTLTDAYAFRAAPPVAGGGSTITNATGFYSAAITGATNNYTANFHASSTQTLWVSGNADNTTAAAGIAFGSSRDTRLYRGAAFILQTDGSFGVGGTPLLGSRLYSLPNPTAVGGSGTLVSGYLQNSGAVAIAGAQTGNVHHILIGSLTVTADSPSTVPDLCGVTIVGSVPSTNVTATRSQALMVLTGADANTGISVRQNSGTQSGNLIQFANSAGTTIASIGSGAQFNGPDGTVANPAFRFVNSTGTGFYRAGADILAASTGGVERWRTTAEGAFLLGTTTNAAMWFRIGAGATHPDTTSATTVYGIDVDYASASTATTAMYGIRNRVRTAAAAYTVVDTRMYEIQSPVIGAGSAITTFRGYSASNLGAAGIGSSYAMLLQAQSGSDTGSYGARIDAATTATLWVSGNADNTTAAAGIAFGASRDTNLYRAAAGILRTDGTLSAGGTATNNAKLYAQAATSMTGSAGSIFHGLYLVGSTITFTGAQTGATLANAFVSQMTYAAGSASTIADAVGLIAMGPIASTNVTFTRGAAMLAMTGADANMGISIRQNSGSQSGNLLELQNSAGATLSAIAAAGHFRAPGGSVGAPGISFLSETGTGLYSISSLQCAIALGGSKIVGFATNDVRFSKKIFPASDALAEQTAIGLSAGTGAPNNANGANGDIYFRSDGGALTTIYQRRAGAWVGIA